MKVVGIFKNAQRTVSLAPGEVVFQEGDAGDEMYGIIQGGIDIHHSGRVVNSLGPDDVFGEMALVDKSPRSGSAVATSDTVLAVIDRERFLFLVHETPTFALSVMSTMAERQRRLD